MPSQVAGISERQQLIIQHLEEANQELSGQDLHARLRASNSPMGLADQASLLATGAITARAGSPCTQPQSWARGEG